MHPSSRSANNGVEVNVSEPNAPAPTASATIRPTREAGSRPMARTPRRHTTVGWGRGTPRRPPAWIDPALRGAGRAGRHGHPRPVAGGLGAELAAEQHDRAQVLRRRREAQLRDQLAPTRQRFEPEVATEHQTDHDDDDGEHDRQHVERALVDAPERDVAGEVARRDPRETGRRVVPDPPGDRRLPGEEQRADAGGCPARKPDGVGDDAGADEQRADDRPVDRTARRPGGARCRTARWRRAGRRSRRPARS